MEEDKLLLLLLLQRAGGLSTVRPADREPCRAGTRAERGPLSGRTPPTSGAGLFPSRGGESGGAP